MQERQEMEESQGWREKGVKGRRREGGRQGGREREEEKQRGRGRDHRHDDIIGINEDPRLASPWIAK